MSALPQCVSLPFPQITPDVPESDVDTEPDVLPLQLTGSLGALTRKQYRRKLWERHPYCKFCGGKVKYENATLDHLTHNPKEAGISSGTWYLPADGATKSKQIGPSNSGPMIF